MSDTYDAAMRACPAGVTCYMICAECEDSPTRGCWSCYASGIPGLIECDDPDAYDGPHSLIFVHGDDCPGHDVPSIQ